MKKFILSLFVLAGTVSIIIATCYGLDTNIKWTDDEISFIENHSIIRIGVDPKFMPFEFIDEDGEYKGIAADYISLISKKTGMQFKITNILPWPETYDLALLGDVDVLPAISKTNEREMYFLFSEPYYYSKRVIVTKGTDTMVSDIEDLNELIVAVQRNSSHHSYLLSYPRINLSLYDSVEAALTSVANGTERVFVGNLATADYLIRSNGLTNLKFTAFEAEKHQALYFAVRKEWPELVSIFNKVLDTITEREKIAINKKWIHFEHEIDYGPLIRIISIIGIFIAVVMLVSFYWIIRLRKEIKKRILIQTNLESAKQEAERANEFKSSFMARMSHEIRTPLNAIIGMSYLLKKTKISLTQKMYLNRINQASNNMLGIINDILDFSKIEAGKVELEITSFSMDQVIQKVISIISYKANEQKIEFRLFRDPLVPNWFLGDSKRIEQILINTLNNAVKFTDKGSVVLDIRLLAKENDRYHISFSIKDTGIGMSKEQTEKLFMPFTQADISISRRFGGTGLGLSIVKNLVDMMDGKIKVFSTKGEGSTFIIDLSLCVDKDKENEQIRNLYNDRIKSIKTLVLEETETDMNIIENYLSSFKILFEVAASPVSAMSMLEAADGKEAKSFDLLIIDYEINLDDAFKFIELIQSNSKITKVPKSIIVLPMMREDLLDKLNGYKIDIGITKPIIPSVLLNSIIEIFNQKSLSNSQQIEKTSVSTEKFERLMTVLVVEDNKTNQYITKSLLQQEGIEPILADSGKAAIELYNLHKNKIDIIIMDLHMPIMNGYETAREIRKISDSIPIVAMTADVIQGVKEKCEQSGIYDYISKPFEPELFIQTIKNIIMDNANSKVDEINVLDQSAGLINMGGSMEIYREVLNEYHKENRDTLDKLSLSISEKRYADAAQIIHKIKGSSGTIGAKSLYELSIKLQKALEEEKTHEILLLQKNFSDILSKLLEELNKF